MKITLVNPEQTTNAKKNLKLEITKVYDLGLSIINKLWLKNQGLLNEFRFVYAEDREESGWFTYTIEGDEYRKITINLAQVKTYRDLLYTILHEWRHARQYKDYGRNAMFLLTRDSNDEGYEQSRIERDADAYAFRQESKLRYKNFVINPTVSHSIFIERKKTATFDS